MKRMNDDVTGRSTGQTIRCIERSFTLTGKTFSHLSEQSQPQTPVSCPNRSPISCLNASVNGPTSAVETNKILTFRDIDHPTVGITSRKISQNTQSSSSSLTSLINTNRPPLSLLGILAAKRITRKFLSTLTDEKHQRRLSTFSRLSSYSPASYNLINYLPTFQLGPKEIFNISSIKPRIEQLLESRIESLPLLYERFKANRLCITLTNEIKAMLKAHGEERRYSTIYPIKNTLLIHHKDKQYTSPKINKLKCAPRSFNNDPDHQDDHNDEYVLNAPRPSLKFNEDNILFVKKENLSKFNEELLNENDLDPIHKEPISSTPFYKSTTKSLHKGSLFNLALIVVNNELVKPTKISHTYNPLSNETSLMIFRCRICLDENDHNNETESLLSPCRCKGTVGLVHRKCLEKWLLTSGKPNCELCGYAYIMTPSKRHSSQFSTLNQIRRFSNEIRSFRDWLRWERTRRHLIADIICMILLTPATYIGVYFCVIGAFGYAELNPYSWQVFGLWGLAVLLVLLLTIWMILAIRHHLGNYRSYQHHQQQMALAEANRLSALPRYRFSIQPRPRGSSVVLYTIHREQESSPLPKHETQVSMNSSIESLDINSLNNRGVESSCSNKYPNGNQKIVVSVELTTVPEVAEEMSTSNNKVSFDNIV
ncbi:membrane associated ring finger 1,8, putative [Schistosoma mansoni]|uniref:membrane associated ring finger 1,8, putative n=1 Tax=Schistosoma mansoni TaxID=6183 RepID=UPI0001A63230|nr:membrane associated ring finger 1,8, putative [Schistosoma mansoni]|eukprot:XP_018646269.1 membrane associated ring finger 1,8, putative [Schistosoma mansoni]